MAFSFHFLSLIQTRVELHQIWCCDCRLWGSSDEAETTGTLLLSRGSFIAHATTVEARACLLEHDVTVAFLLKFQEQCHLRNTENGLFNEGA